VVTLPAGVSLSDFKNCLHCYESDPAFALDETMFLKELFEMVIKPVADSQALFDSRPYLTRLYTTMSAADMTIDPVFAFNPDLHDFSNLHVATQEFGCGNSNNPITGNASWTIKLPQGDLIRGSGGSRVWPITANSQPAALRIMQIGTSGQPKVLEDHSKAISEMIEASNPPPPSGSTTKPTAGSGGVGGSASGTPPGAAPGLGIAGNGNDLSNANGAGSAKGDGGCNVAHGGGSDALWLLIFAGLALMRRRRS
jgi:MYXO-CTERM domain-containing protein